MYLLLLCMLFTVLDFLAITEMVNVTNISQHAVPCCCLPTPMALASGGSPMFPLVVHQPASPSIWPAVQSLQRACPQIQGRQCGAYVGAVDAVPFAHTSITYICHVCDLIRWCTFLKDYIIFCHPAWL